MNLKKIKKDGFFISKNFFDIKDIKEMEKALVLYSTLYIKKFSKKIFKRGVDILKDNKDFNKKSLSFFNSIEKFDQKIFYEICKNIFRIEIVNTFFKNPKVEKLLKSYFGKSYLVIQKAHPMLLFNSIDTKRLVFQWHQECHFYNQKKGLHLWFPIFRDIKAVNDGSIKIAIKSNKTIYEFKVKKNKNGYLQKIPNINVEKKFQIKNVKLNRGDVVFFDHKTFHKTDNQLNKIPRIGIVVKFLADGDKNQLSFINQ